MSKEAMPSVLDVQTSQGNKTVLQGQEKDKAKEILKTPVVEQKDLIQALQSVVNERAAESRLGLGLGEEKKIDKIIKADKTPVKTAEILAEDKADELQKQITELQLSNQSLVQQLETIRPTDSTLKSQMFAEVQQELQAIHPEYNDLVSRRSHFEELFSKLPQTTKDYYGGGKQAIAMFYRDAKLAEAKTGQGTGLVGSVGMSNSGVSTVNASEGLVAKALSEVQEGRDRNVVFSRMFEELIPKL